MKLRSGCETENTPKNGSCGVARYWSSLIKHLENHDLRKFAKLWLSISMTVFMAWFIVFPVVIKVCPFILTEFVFLQRLRWPPFINLTNPEDVRLQYTKHFNLQSEEGVVLGAWHVLPKSLQTGDISSIEEFQNSLHNGNPVFLYFHGNVGTRAAWHRVQLYKQLANLNFHVLTVDYRGFADSTGYPSEEGVVRDALFLYSYVRSVSPTVPVYIWGHSLGTAISTKMTKALCQMKEPVNGLVLEAPFDNIIAAGHEHPISFMFKVMPWFEWIFLEGLHHANLSFQTDQNILEVNIPVLILHAEDDGIVPFKLGQRLYEVAKKANSAGVEFVGFEGKLGYGHKHIHKAPALPSIIRKFTGWNTEQ